MPPEIHSTKDIVTDGVKILVYGASGAGKTRLITTLPKPIILSAESGLLSLKKYKLPYILINNIDDLQKAYEWLVNSEDAAQYESIALDSISEIAEIILSAGKKRNKDPRAAYGEMQDEIAEIIRVFRDFPGKHVYMTAKLEKSQDEMGKILYAPSMPGNKAAQALPYFFDEVLAIRVEKNAEGKKVRYLQTDADGVWSAKDRSDTLDTWEDMDLGAIIEKIAGYSVKEIKKNKNNTVNNKSEKTPSVQNKTKSTVDFETDDEEENDD